jgi:hypothetical protein
MVELPKGRTIRTTSAGIIPFLAAAAILLIMVGCMIVVLLGGSVSVQFAFP